ncbi:hypothetical protein [Sphingomonas parapaucimobilis]|uniref:hypothetical protein n=1 Tax=Sphingomonas parapaucimobilis TaxID=28213 RepID=UPI00391D2294
MLKYLDEGNGEPNVEKVIYTVMDKEPTWQHVAELFIENIESNIEVKLLFIQLDIASNVLPTNASLHEEDAVFMSFFISEICKLPNQAKIKSNISHLMKSLPAGKRVFYNDSNAFSFYSYVNNNIRANGVMKEVLDIDCKYTADFPDTDGLFSEYQEDFGYGQKLNGNAVSKVLERI